MKRWAGCGFEASPAPAHHRVTMGNVTVLWHRLCQNVTLQYTVTLYFAIVQVCAWQNMAIQPSTLNVPFLPAVTIDR